MNRLICFLSLFLMVMINRKAKAETIQEKFKIDFGKTISFKALPDNINDTPKLYGTLGIEVSNKLGTPEINTEAEPELVKAKWGDDITVDIFNTHDTNCRKVIWKKKGKQDIFVKDCYEFGNAHWYGGMEYKEQIWPIEKIKMSRTPYVPQKHDNMSKTEPYWLNSKGVYIYIDDQVPLFIEMNSEEQKSICFLSNSIEPYPSTDVVQLAYNVCSFEDSRKAQEHAIKTFLGKPDDIPDTRMVIEPVWTTAMYKFNINTEILLNFANDIVLHGYKRSNMSIEDNWESCYGSFQFCTRQYDDPKKMTTQLSKLGFRTTIWVHPFINTFCLNFNLLKKKGFFVENQSRDVKMSWWRGRAAVLDFTNQEMVDWFIESRLKFMEEFGVDGLKFDVGETSWLPQLPKLHGSLLYNPYSYSNSYIDTASQFGPLTEVKIAYKTQKYPIYVRMMDKNSRWGLNNGLASIVTSLLVLNITGYPWVLPDVIGGNIYNSNDELTAELFIRWAQATVFMPVIQFSITPWSLGDETNEICKKLVELHHRYSRTIVELMKKTIDTGAPLNPPIWWIDPKNKIAHSISDEYMLGEETLVAPVLEKGAISRDIYLPAGLWRDENNPDVIYDGRMWLRDYPAALDTLPFFTRVSS